MTLDGKIASKTGDSFWITSEKSREFARQLRAEFGAVLVGSGTVINDDPQLNYRGEKGMLEPVRIILDPTNKVSKDSKVLNSPGGKVIHVKVSNNIAPKTFCITHYNSVASADLPGVVDYIIPGAYARENKIQLDKLIRWLSENDGLAGLLVEGGSRTLTNFFEENIVDEVIVSIAPKIIGGAEALSPVEGKGIAKMKNALQLKNVCLQIVDEKEVFVRGFINLP